MTLEAWVRDNRSLGHSVIKLEHGDKSGVFQMSSSYSVGGDVRVSIYPRYYIWSNDVLVKITSTYQEALAVWAEVRAQSSVPA